MFLRQVEQLVLPDRTDLRLQSCLVLILLRFSVQRSVFVWHSCVARLVLESTPQGPRVPSRLLLALPRAPRKWGGRARTSAIASVETCSISCSSPTPNRIT